jgi:hypothetical protein
LISSTARVTVPAARNSTASRVSVSRKKTQALITMLVERDWHGIGWFYWVMEGTIYRGWETQGVAAPRGKP